MPDLIQQIEEFMDAHQLSEWQFGEQAVNDRHFVRQLRAGRDLRMSTVERVRRFMTEFNSPTSPQEAA
ncbi:hypothetical protein [Novosphingobium sp. NDB2Meth1]|uniref:hypothetical protein n=1 Tax=Novosphingobium sp. NDB2Meth1 TaxID=1892847 RepID=UPI000931EEC1|nr:hypothetical protein [Novosphingobium sp. NDB2Meth1]